MDPVQLASELRLRKRKSLLRFNACGGVNDGKSTLIGCLLCEAKSLFDKQLRAFEADSKRRDARSGELDRAPLLDASGAEREPGLRVEVAYRFFSSERRQFIVADSSGHEHSTRNMVSGASTAELSVIVCDARKGLLSETKRFSQIVALLGIRHAALVVNKMDLVDYSQDAFSKIEAEYRRFAGRLGISEVSCIPVSAIEGDNVVHRGENMPWYVGPTLMALLDSVEIDEARRSDDALRLPVQWVKRQDAKFSSIAGTVVAGSLKAGDAIRVQPSGRTSRVTSIVTSDGDLREASVGQAVTLTLEDELDVARGDMISSADSPAEVADQFEASVIWMSREPLLRGRSYSMRIGPNTVGATISPIKYKIDVDTLARGPAPLLDGNEIGVCNLELDRPIAYDSYATNRDTGGFILVDPATQETLGAGMLHFALRRANNVHWQALDVSPRARAAIKGQKPCALWYTGLSGAGKSAIANLVDRELYRMNRHGYVLDGDNVRHGLNKDLGFTAADRVENIRRIAEVAKLMVDAGLIVSAAFISPFRAERRMARALFEPGEFIEIYVDTPLAVAEQRDPKGLYKKARRGELKNFTGIDSPYECPEQPELVIDTVVSSPERAAAEIVKFLMSRGIFDVE